MKKILLTTGIITVLLYGGAVYANSRYHSNQNRTAKNIGYYPYHENNCEGHCDENAYYYHKTSNNTTNCNHHETNRKYTHHAHKNHH